MYWRWIYLPLHSHQLKYNDVKDREVDVHDAIMTSDSDRTERTTLEHLPPVEPTGKDTAEQGMRKGSLVYYDRITIHLKHHPSI